MMEVRYVTTSHRKDAGGEAGGTADIIVVRHGSTDYNQGGVGHDRLRGQLNLTLDADGEQQAREVSAQLATERITTIIASDLRRTLDTALVIAGPHNEPVYGEPALRSWNMGDLQGQRVTDDVIQLIEYYVRQQYEAPPNGESFAMFKSRLCRAYTQILRDTYPGDCVLLVLHARCIQMLELWMQAQMSLEELNTKYVDAMLDEPDTVQPGGYIRLRRGVSSGWTIVERWKAGAETSAAAS